MDITTLTALIAAAVEKIERDEIGNPMSEEEKTEALSRIPAVISMKDFESLIKSFEYLNTISSTIYTSEADNFEAFFEGRFEDVNPKIYGEIESLFLSALRSYGTQPDDYEFPVISRELAESPYRVDSTTMEKMAESREKTERAEEVGEEKTAEEKEEEEKLKTEVQQASAEESERVTEEELEEAEEEERSAVDKVREALGEDGWVSLMYRVIQAMEAGASGESLDNSYRKHFKNFGASWESAKEVAADIITASHAEGYTNNNWIDGTVPEEYVKERFYDERFEEICAHPEVEDAAARAIRKAILSYGSPGVESYILTDSALEDMTAYYVRGKKLLRIFTSSNTFGSNLKPTKDGIFSEELLGPQKRSESGKSQNCMCGRCNKDDSDADAKAGEVCPECGYPIMSSDDRDKTYGLIESPFPLLMGRGDLVSMMLDKDEILLSPDLQDDMDKGKLTLEQIVSALEQGDSDTFAYKNDEGVWLLAKGVLPPVDGEVLYGTEALEVVLSSLSGRTGIFKGKEYPLAIINARKNLEEKSKEIERPSAKDNKKTQQKKKKKQENYLRALNYFSTIWATLIDRGGRPEDFLLHYIPVPPATTRPLNDRNGSSDYGEDNKLYISLIRQRNTIEKIIKAGGQISTEKWLQYERRFNADVRKLISLGRDSFYNKNGRLYKKLMSTRANNCIRSVITPTDNITGQGWLRLESGGELDIPAMDLIGLPRVELRVMYEKEVKAVLQRMGYSDAAIVDAFNEPAGTMEKTEDGRERRCLVDSVLDEVILNRNPENGNAQGRMTLYMRHPVITDGSVQAGYIYPVDHDAIALPIARCKAMNADFDGDTGLAVKMEAPDRDPDTGRVFTKEDKKAYTKAIRAELKRHMDSTILDRGSEELLVTPRLESLLGLYKITGPIETYTFDDKVIICEDELSKLREDGILNSNGKLNAQASICVNHVIDELELNEIWCKPGVTVEAGTVYGARNGKQLVAEESLMLVERNGRIYAIAPFKDYIRAPKGAVLTGNKVINPGEKLCTVKPLILDRATMLSGLKSGQFVYNQPVYTLDGELTTPGRVAVENILEHKLPFKDTGFNSKDIENLLKEEIKAVGIEKGKKKISLLTRLGFAVNTLLGDRLKPEQFPTTKPISHEQIYKPGDREKAHRMAFGHKDVVLEGCRLKNKLWHYTKAKSLPPTVDMGDVYRVKKGFSYGWGPDNRPLIAEYDMILFRNSGEQWYTARDVAHEAEDYISYVNNVQRYTEIKRRIESGNPMEGDTKLLKDAAVRLQKAYTVLMNRLEHLEATYLNDIKASRYEPLREELGKKVIAQLSRNKNNILYDSIRAGIKKEDLAISMVAIGITKDYAGNTMEPVLGSLILGLVGAMRILNETTAVINGNKTLNVDIIGAIGNMLMAALEGFRYEEGDCGTTEYRTHAMPDVEDEVNKLAVRLEGRTVAADIITGEGEVLAVKGDTFSKKLVTDAYHKGIKTLPQRSATYCRCRGTCEACAGKMRGVIPEYGAELGFSAKNSLVAPFSQGTMSRAKAAGGGKMENGGDILMNLVSGAYMKDVEKDDTVKDFVENFADSFYDSGKIKFKDLPPVFTELFAKALVYYREDGLASTIMRAIIGNESLADKKGDSCFVNYDAGKIQNTFMSYMAKDSISSKMGAFGGRSKATPMIRSNTIYREKHGEIGRAV